MTYTESGSLNAGTVSLIGASTGSAPANSVPVGWEHNLKLTLPNFFARDSKWGSGSWHIPALQGCTSLPCCHGVACVGRDFRVVLVERTTKKRTEM